MADDSKYRFKIGAYSPKTIPLGRLLSYLQEFKKLLPHPDHVHLVGVEDGSTMPAFYIEPQYQIHTVEQLIKIEKGNGTQVQQNAYAEIGYLADEDGAAQVSFLQPDGNNIINFPRKTRPAPNEELVIKGVKEPLTIFASAFKTGRPRQNTQKYEAYFTDMKNGDSIKASMSVELGIELGKVLETELSVTGVASWSRSESGEWSIASFEVSSFEEFKPRRLEDTFLLIKERANHIPDDIYERLEKHRSDD